MDGHKSVIIKAVKNEGRDLSGLTKRVTGIIRIFFLLVLGAGLGLGGEALLSYQSRLSAREHFASNDHRSSSVVGGLTSRQYRNLSQISYHSGQSPVFQVNNGRSTLNPNSWKTSHVDYQQLDRLGRTSRANTAFLDWRNHANTTLRTQQTVAPAAWHGNRDQLLIYNRGHLIAYSLTRGINQQTGNFDSRRASGDQDNPRNLFTESDFTNQALQTLYEGQVRRAIESHRRVIYQATPIFRGTELMPRGINLQAISTDGTLNFNVYLANVEPGVRFDYQSGNAIFDPQMSVPVPLDPMGDTEDNHQEQQDNLRVVDGYTRPVAKQPRHYQRISDR